MKDGWDKAKDLAQIVSLVAVPVLVAVFGWQIQRSITDQQVRRDYVQMAIQVLAPADGATRGRDLRQWATSVINANAPLPLTESLAGELAGIVVRDTFVRIPLPPILAEPCGPIATLPEPTTFDDVLAGYIALMGEYSICALRHRSMVEAWGGVSGSGTH